MAEVIVVLAGSPDLRGRGSNGGGGSCFGGGSAIITARERERTMNDWFGSVRVLTENPLSRCFLVSLDEEVKASPHG